MLASERRIENLTPLTNSSCLDSIWLAKPCQQQECFDFMRRRIMKFNLSWKPALVLISSSQQNCFFTRRRPVKLNLLWKQLLLLIQSSWQSFAPKACFSQGGELWNSTSFENCSWFSLIGNTLPTNKNVFLEDSSCENSTSPFQTSFQPKPARIF